MKHDRNRIDEQKKRMERIKPKSESKTNALHPPAHKRIKTGAAALKITTKTICNGEHFCFYTCSVERKSVVVFIFFFQECVGIQ